MPIKINGSTSGSVTLAAPATGSDVTVTLPATAGTIPLSASATLSDPTFTGNVVWSGATLRAATASVATQQSTASTSPTDLATSGPAVTVTTGTKALVIVGASLGTLTTGMDATMGFAVSGASTVAASIPNASRNYINQSGMRWSSVILLTGLTAGSNTFTAKYWSANATTAYFADRYITVIDMGS